VPEVDLLPTWVGCVAFVVWQRKKENGPLKAAARAGPREINVTPTPADMTAGAPPLLSAAPAAASPPEPLNPTADRLQKLKALRDQNLISPAEFDAKRRQILSDL
jgi:hypothetical protein